MTRVWSKLEQSFLCYTGLETDLIFNQNVALPSFATFPLLESEAGRKRLIKSYTQQIDLAREMGCGTTLETVTWVANKDRAAPLGYEIDQLAQIQVQAIEMVRTLANAAEDVPVLVSAQIGPRSDGYQPDFHMDDKEAEQYHAVQMAQIAAASRPDIVSAFTLSYPEEAIGIVRAAERHELPVAISFTLETDGLLPTGMPLGEALMAVDAATDQYADYYLINCAHPDHFLPNLTDAPWMARLGGVVVNASRCSHEELDNATILDAGDPEQLGAAIGLIKSLYPHMRIFGGCCGTDLRHMRAIAQQVA